MSEQPMNPEVTSDDKLWAALAYVFAPIVGIIVLLMEDKKSRPFIKFHAVQSIAAAIVLFIVVPIIAIPTFGCGSVIYLIMFWWAYKAYQGEFVEIPVLTNFIKGQGWA
jgi:uncharacterized membrane protein